MKIIQVLFLCIPSVILAHLIVLPGLGVKSDIFKLVSPVQVVLAQEPTVVDDLPPRFREEVTQLHGGERVTISGQLQKRVDGNVYLLPQREPQPGMAIRNPKAVSTGAVGLPIEAEVSVRGQGVRVEGLSLRAVQEWKKVSKDLPIFRYEQVHRAFDELELVSHQALKPGAMSGDLDSLSRQTGVTQREVIDSFARLNSTESDERLKLIRTYSALRELRKAVYNRDNRWDPENFDRIFRNSKGTVALADKGYPVSFCSGVLISKDLVLTCRHCLKSRFVDEIEIRFNYETDLSQRNLPVDAYPVEQVAAEGDKRGIPGIEPLDFAVLRLGKNPKGALAGDVWPVQCLSLHRVKRDDPLYVVGHPNGSPRSVADHSFVLFPYKVTAHRLNELKLLVGAEFQNDPDWEKRIKEFADSYVQVRSGTREHYLHYSRRWGKQPTIAAEADTFHGNSGSPAYAKKNHMVVGLLFAGEPDLSDSWRPGWRRHEAILPISEVVKQLDQQLPDWRSSEGVFINP